MTANASGVLPARTPRRRLFVALVGMGVLLVLASQIARQTPVRAGLPFPSVPATACQGPGSAYKAGQTLTFDWHPAVEIDRPQGSVIVLVSGPDVQMCVVYRSMDDSMESVVSGIGGNRGDTRSGLTLDSGMDFTTEGSDIVYGRVPPGTSRVTVSVGNPSDEVATVANGYWLVWLAVPATPVGIDAFDAGGHLLQRLEDPNGLQFGG